MKVLLSSLTSVSPLLPDLAVIFPCFSLSLCILFYVPSFALIAKLLDYKKHHFCYSSFSIFITEICIGLLQSLCFSLSSSHRSLFHCALQNLQHSFVFPRRSDILTALPSCLNWKSDISESYCSMHPYHICFCASGLATSFTLLYAEFIPEFTWSCLAFSY